MRLRIQCLAIGVIACGTSASSSLALLINPSFVDDAGATWTDTRKDVVWQGISDWTSSILATPTSGEQEFDITFTFASAGTDGYLGLWQGSVSYFQGDDILPWYDGVDHTITFNVDYFDENEDNYVWWGLDAGEQPFEAWDALSVVRHELGHALGYAGLYRSDADGPSQHIYYDALVSGSTFDLGGLNIDLAGSGDIYHVSQDYKNLMSPALVNSVRRDIEQMNLDMLESAYGYTVIPEPMTVGLWGVGLVGIMGLRRRRRRQWMTAADPENQGKEAPGSRGRWVRVRKRRERTSRSRARLPY